MKKFMSTILAVLICSTVLIGCGKSDPIQEDLINYINVEIPTIVDTENKVRTEYSASTGTNYIDDASLGAKLKDVVIPTSNELVTKAKAIVPKTDEVAKLHNKYIALVTEQHEAFNLFLKAVQTSDAALVTTANEKLKNTEKVAEEYLSELTALKEEHEVETK